MGTKDNLRKYFLQHPLEPLATETVDRVVDVFPPEQQQQIRIQLSNSLIAVFSQTLLPKLNEVGMA